MDNRVRDLDQIQEREGDERGRRIGTILLAAAALVGLTFAMGVVVGRAAEPPPEPVDPLAKLDRQANAKAIPSAGSEPVVPKVDAADLSFPATLGEAEERPEVLAALKAAADEEAALAPEQPAQQDPGAALNAAAPRTGVAVDEALGDTVSAIPSQFEAGEPSEVATEELIASVPAAVAAGPGARSLPRTARHDPMVAQALRNDDENGEIAPRGHDGEFTLQVISYDSPEPSRAFAEGLRAKGHSAFVVAADIPDRGRYYRVRIGPFKNRFQADAYRRKFESDEQMNTFVVREK
ncbi:MAG TPA: SPOR domain-containing protein, partial [Polyangiales bacterium]|nr:SPOR domain-containing protein [Polyangiales bacterium]